MSTNAKRPDGADPPGEASAPPPGRHRATVDARSAFPPAALPLLLGGAAVVLLAAVIAWQVL